MSQEEVIKVLKKARKPLTSKEIAERIGDTNKSTVSANLAKLHKYDEVIKIPPKGRHIWSKGRGAPKWKIG